MRQFDGANHLALLIELGDPAITGDVHRAVRSDVEGLRREFDFPAVNGFSLGSEHKDLTAGRFRRSVCIPRRRDQGQDPSRAIRAQGLQSALPIAAFDRNLRHLFVRDLDGPCGWFGGSVAIRFRPQRLCCPDQQTGQGQDDTESSKHSGMPFIADLLGNGFGKTVFPGV